MLLVLVPVFSAFAQTFEQGGVFYEVTDAQNKFVSLIRGYDCKGDVVLPESVTYRGTDYKIVNIADTAFLYCLGITSISIPEGVVSIGEDAFSFCTNLKSLTIPESVKSIKENAFSYCVFDTINWYSELSLRSSLRPAQFSSLKSITLGGGVNEIEDELFSYCDSLTSVTILNGVTRIGVAAFNGVSNLTSIIIPSSVRKICIHAFSWCKKLTDVTISNGVDTIEYGAFKGCDALNSITIPKSVSFIGNRAFENCGLSQVIIDGNPEIGVNAFLNSHIEKVISKSVTPSQMKYYNPFVVGEPEDVIPYGERTNVYDSTLGRVITKIEFSNYFIRNSCFVNVTTVPAGKYRISVGILPSPDTIPNVLHPIITGITDNGTVVLFDSVKVKERGSKISYYPYEISNKDKYIIDTIRFVYDIGGIEVEDIDYNYTYASNGHDTLAIIDELVVPDSVKGLSIELQSRNGAGYLLLDRVFLEPLNGMPSPDSYSGPFAESVFNNATLYVPEESVDAYRAADGWKWFKNIAIDTAVDPICWDNQNNTGSPVLYDLFGRKVESDGVERLQPGLYIINGKKYLKR